MLPEQLVAARQSSGLTQQQSADRLGVSQAYLALMERGLRRVTERMGLKLMKVYGLGPVALPAGAGGEVVWDSRSLASALGALGYPGFRQLRGRRRWNPADVVFGAVAAGDLEVRVVEALPWVMAEYWGLDWEWLVRAAKLRDVQNRLGFLVSLARQVAQKRGDEAAGLKLGQVLEVLERARLVREDTLCQESLSEAERRWLRRARPDGARHWKLLTDLNAGLLDYAA